MPEITLALQEPLLCDGSLVESGNEVDIYLNDEIFDAQTITDYSPVRATVDSVAYTGTSKCPKGVVITVTTTTDLPPSVLTLDPCDISKISCVGCCVENAEAIDALDVRVTDLENASSVFDYGLTRYQIVGGPVDINETHFQSILAFQTPGSLIFPPTSEDNWGARVGVNTNEFFEAAELVSVSGARTLGMSLVHGLLRNSGLHIFESTIEGWIMIQSPQSTINGFQARRFALAPTQAVEISYSAEDLMLEMGGMLELKITGWDGVNAFYTRWFCSISTNGSDITAMSSHPIPEVTSPDVSLDVNVTSNNLIVEITAGSEIVEGTVGISYVAPNTIQLPSGGGVS